MLFALAGLIWQYAPQLAISPVPSQETIERTNPQVQQESSVVENTSLQEDDSPGPQTRKLGTPDTQTTEEKSAQVSEVNHPFTIAPTPKNARVRIMNIVERYKDGIGLPPGSYTVEVSATGYTTKLVNVTHGRSPTLRSIELQIEQATASERSFDLATRPAPSEQTEQQLYTAAFESMREGDYEEATKKFLGLISTFPQGLRRNDVAYWLGEIYLATDKLQLAIQQFSAVEGQGDGPKRADAIYKLGLAHDRAGNTRVSTNYLEQVIQEYPGSSAAHLAEQYQKTRQTTETKPRRVVSGKSESELYNDAFNALKSREFDKAIEMFSRVTLTYPNGELTASAFYWLGELYLAENETENARQSFAQVINLFPRHQKVPDALYKMGVVHHRLGDRQRALEFFDRVKGDHPYSSAAGLARTYAAELN